MSRTNHARPPRRRCALCERKIPRDRAKMPGSLALYCTDACARMAYADLEVQA